MNIYFIKKLLLEYSRVSWIQTALGVRKLLHVKLSIGLLRSPHLLEIRLCSIKHESAQRWIKKVFCLFLQPTRSRPRRLRRRPWRAPLAAPRRSWPSARRQWLRPARVRRSRSRCRRSAPTPWTPSCRRLTAETTSSSRGSSPSSTRSSPCRCSAVGTFYNRRIV